MKSNNTNKAGQRDKFGSVLADDGQRSALLTKIVLPALVFCWPFLYLLDHVLPVNGYYTGIGNDFFEVYYKHKVYLLANLANFRLPLWSPAESAGFPFYSNPYAQAFYPLNLPLAVWYKASGGYNVLDHSVFTILAISIFALGLYRWLMTINTNLRAVIFSCLVMSVSFKVTELLRFPNALHSAAWYPWVLFAITKIMFSGSLKKAIYYGGLLIFFVFCICTAGYPYYVFYCPFLFLPYTIVFLIRPLRQRLFGNQEIHWKRALGSLIVSGFTALLFAGPYLWSLKQLMSQTVDRWQKNLQFSTSHVFNIGDTLGSLVYPPNSETEGWYFFGITGLLLIILYLFSSRGEIYKNLRTNDHDNNNIISPMIRDPWVKLFFIVWIAAISYITYGRSSYLFILLWKVVPVFSSLRVWGRLNIVLVPILAWLLSLAYASFESTLLERKDKLSAKYRRLFYPIVLLIVTYAAIISVQLYFYLNDISNVYWKEYLKYLSPLAVWFIVYGVVAFAVVLLILVFSRHVKFSRAIYLNIVLGVLVLSSVIEMRPVGAHTWAYPAKVQNSRVNIDVERINEVSFRFPRTDRNDSISLGPNFSAGILEQWYLERYVKFFTKASTELQARKKLLGVEDGTKLFFSESIEHPSIASFLNDASRYQNIGRPVFYNGDQLIWEINAPVNGNLSFIDNWYPGWKVFVDDKPAHMELLFGTFKSVRLSPGTQRVSFCFQPTLADFLGPSSLPQSSSTKSWIK